MDHCQQVWFVDNRHDSCVLFGMHFKHQTEAITRFNLKFFIFFLNHFQNHWNNCVLIRLLPSEYAVVVSEDLQ